MVAKTRSVWGYDRLACWYGWLERLVFGRDLQRARTALINRLPEVKSALVLGDGDGRLLQALVEAQPSCQFTSVEQSPRMITAQRDRISNINAEERVEWIEGDATTVDLASRSFDSLVVSCFLDCFSGSQLDEHLPRWLSTVQPGGLVYYVDFVLPENGIRRVRAHCLSLVMHVFFGLLTGLPNRTLMDVRSRLNELGLNRVASWSGNRGFLVCELYRHQR